MSYSLPFSGLSDTTMGTFILVTDMTKASIVWYGSGRCRKGELSTDSGVLTNTPYSFRTRFRITRAAPTLRASVANLDQSGFTLLARDAQQNCPVSKVLNVEITLNAKLVLDPQP